MRVYHHSAFFNTDIAIDNGSGRRKFRIRS